uniref:Phosphoinositide 3-kinase regulatory subunit 5 n=1 Tax=Periophthalmus magnuspinnatus TaxID=409849 RepID=A0A3B3ZUG6_9GOBI
MEVFRVFLTWPEPYCSVCKTLLTALQVELKVPGISFQRLVREEQALSTSRHFSKTVTVLLMNPGEVPVDFLTVAEQLSRVQHSQRDAGITLIKHAFQSALGATYPLSVIRQKIYKNVAVFTFTRGIVANRRAAFDKLSCFFSGMLQTLPLPTAKCHMFYWEKDNFGNASLESAKRQPIVSLEDDEVELDVDEVDVTAFDLDDKDGEELLKEAGQNGAELPSLIHDCASSYRASTFSTISSLSTASKDSMFSTLSITSESYAASLLSSGVDSDFCDDLDDYICPSPVTDKSSLKSGNKTRLCQHFQRIFRPKSPRLLYRAKSLGNTESKDLVVVREKRSNSLPQQVHLRSLETQLNAQNQALRHVCFRRRPILSSDEEIKNTTLRVVVFGADHVAGKLARAYSSLRRRESACPRLTRAFNLQFYFVPVKRDGAGRDGGEKGTPPTHVSVRAGFRGHVPPCDDATLMGTGNSTNDIAHLLGMLDPWYERNTLSLLNLPPNVVCQVPTPTPPKRTQTSKTESDSYDSSYEQRLPILADLVLYYCRYAARATLIQLYQAELTFAGGEKRTEVFVHSLELGHTAGTRAVKAMGTASKRFGIDGDREAVPLTLDMVYNRVVVSGRSQWKRERKVCTSVNLTKACRNPEEHLMCLSDSKMEYLQLSMTEVIKRQSGKSKKGFNQVRSEFIQTEAGNWSTEEIRGFTEEERHENHKTTKTKQK